MSSSSSSSYPSSSIPRKKRSGFCQHEGVVSERGEASSLVAVPAPLGTATEKKLALAQPSFSGGEPRHGACSSDSQTDFQCEMKGLRLVDLQSLLASVSTRRASCNVYGSPLTVR